MFIYMIQEKNLFPLEIFTRNNTLEAVQGHVPLYSVLLMLEVQP
jgi:hypothetical protein